MRPPRLPPYSILILISKIRLYCFLLAPGVREQSPNLPGSARALDKEFPTTASWEIQWEISPT